MTQRGERGRGLETAEDVLKAIMNLTVSHIPPSPKNIILTVNSIRQKESRKSISERSVRYALALLLQSGSVRKRKVMFEKILDSDDNVIRKNETHTELYEIDRNEIKGRMIDLQMATFKNIKNIKNAPPDLREKIIGIKHHALIEQAGVEASEMLQLEELFYQEGHYLKRTEAKMARDYYLYKELQEILAYLKMWNR